jgi:hypothetical protein
MNCYTLVTEDFVALGALMQSEYFDLIKDVSTFSALDLAKGALQLLNLLDHGGLVLICQPRSASLL